MSTHHALALKAASEHIAANGGPKSFEYASVSGGFLTGFWHGYSDVDVYVVPRKGVVFDTALSSRSGLPVQFNPLSSEKLQELQDGYSSYRIGPGDRSQVEFHTQNSKLASRLLTGTVLVGSAEQRINPDVFRRVAITAGAAQVDRMLEDTAGGLKAGKPLVALRASQSAIDAAIQVALAASGDMHQSEATLYSQLADNPSLVLWRDQVLQLAQPVLRPSSEGTVTADLEDFIVTRAGAAARLVSTVVLEHWSESPARVLGPPERILAQPGRLQLSPFHLLYRESRSIAIIGLDHAFRVNEDTARFWLQLHGSLPTGSQFERKLISAGVLEVASGA